MGFPVIVNFFLHFLFFSASLYAVSPLNSDGKTLLSLLSHWNVVPPSIRFSWNASHSDPCSWAGVQCEAEFVVALNLSSCNISGELGPEIANLKHLGSIDLSMNSLFGSIPSEVGNCNLLYKLDFSSNNLTGEIPESIGKLQNLQYLGLYRNSLNGTVPEYSSLCKLERLEYLVLSSNKLTGRIPSCFLNMSKLIVLDLRKNGFQMIPTELSNGNTLWFLGLSGNQLQGSLSSSLCKLDNLAYLLLSDNKLNGEIPNCVGNMSRLSVLDLQKNGFDGVIPTSFSKDCPLLFLGLNGNQLQGPLPSSLCELESLEYLVLSDNKLFGEIPECFFNMNSLVVLELRKNRFRGMINPGSSPMRNILKTLGLNGNKLQGPLPRSLLNCTSLEILDVGLNNVTDTFPQWLGALPELSVLVLKSNNLRGSIGRSTTSNASFQKLRILDISYNQFNGFLPEDMTNTFRAMRNINGIPTPLRETSDNSYYKESVTLEIKGLEREVTRVLNIYTAIDLSGNSFEGSIPRSIGGLNSLKILNFSHNKFDGVIPPTIGSISALESLDLSWNQLGGNIPAELANLNFLEILNLSRNKLVGRIPSGQQFNTFSISSYGGNPGLCGFPVGDCAPQSYQQKHDSDFLDGMTWKSVLLGFGCGLVLGLLMGGLMFYTQKPKWLHAIVEDMGKQLKRQKKKKGPQLQIIR